MAHDFQLSSETLRRCPPAARYLIAVSGGRDSVVLLHRLLAAGYRRLIVCHLNHGLRGRSAAADAGFVTRLASAAKLPFELRKIDVSALAKEGKQSVEMAARNARYGFFAAVARRRRCHTIFLGHHADDLVETTLLNLFRGSGRSGLASLREFSSREVSGVKLTMVRPFLSVWRNELDAYAKAHRLKFRHDPTNDSLAHTRNRMRHRVLPLIEKEFGREVRRNVWRTADLIAQEEEWLEELTGGKGANAAPLSVSALRVEPIALQRRIIHGWLRHHGIADLSYAVVERVRGLIAADATAAKTNLPRDLHVRRRAGKVFIERLPPPGPAEA